MYCKRVLCSDTYEKIYRESYSKWNYKSMPIYYGATCQSLSIYEHS